MKSSFIQEILAKSIQILPPFMATIVLQNKKDCYRILSESTLLYTSVLTATTIIRHWNIWKKWLKERIKALRTLIDWLRSFFHDR